MLTAPGGSSTFTGYAPLPTLRLSYFSMVDDGSAAQKTWYQLLAAALATRGYVVVVPDYRLYPEIRFPDFLVDGAKALRWTHDNVATLGGDPQRLFVMGHSAGGHIAAMLTLDPQWLDGVGLNAARDIAGLIGISGPYDFLPLRDPTLVDIFGGANRADTQPISFAEGRKPPALLVTGDADKVVSPGNSTRLADRLRHNGNEATEVIYRRLGHMTVLAGFAPLLSAVLPLFLTSKLLLLVGRPGLPQVSLMSGQLRHELRSIRNGAPGHRGRFVARHALAWAAEHALAIPAGSIRSGPLVWDL